MEALSSAGIPIYTEPGRNGGIYLLQDFILDRAALSESERLEVLTKYICHRIYRRTRNGDKAVSAFQCKYKKLA